MTTFSGTTDEPGGSEGAQPEMDFGVSASPALSWEAESAERALDELFKYARRYRSSEEYGALLKFVSRFRWYAPFNAMLVHVQMPGATFVTSASGWLREYRRRVRKTARPLVILQPMGPVMFVFDVSDTEALPDAPDLPPEVINPFEVVTDGLPVPYGILLENAKRDGVATGERQEGSQSGGSVQPAEEGRFADYLIKVYPRPRYARVRVRYQILVNGNHSEPQKLATLIHELAHLYCGHLGTPDPSWWPDRRGLSRDVEELEAESVAYLVCARNGWRTRSAQYLSGYLRGSIETPPISLDCVNRPGFAGDSNP